MQVSHSRTYRLLKGTSTDNHSGAWRVPLEARAQQEPGSPEAGRAGCREWAALSLSAAAPGVLALCSSLLPLLPRLVKSGLFFMLQFECQP